MGGAKHMAQGLPVLPGGTQSLMLRALRPVLAAVQVLRSNSISRRSAPRLNSLV